MKRIQIVLNIIISVIIITLSCKRDNEIYPKDFPYLLMRKVSKINSEGVTATAEILSLGRDSIMDFGFVWDSVESPTIDNLRLSFTDQPHVGIFTGRINNSINSGTLYNIRPYIKGKQYLVYGSTMKFMGSGSLEAKLIDFVPKTGKQGSLVTIFGENFNSNPQVFFGSIEATVKEVFSNKIVVEVPAGKGDVKIYLHQNNKIVESVQNYFIIYPWTEINLPKELVPITFPVSFALNGKGYFVCGEISYSGILSNKVWEYNPSNDEWIQKSDFPGTARRCAVSFVINDKAYLCLGGNTGDRRCELGDFWEYDPNKDLWLRKADFPISAYTKHTYELSTPNALSDNNKGYIGLVTKFWSFDPDENNWEQLSNYPTGIYGFSFAFYVNNKIYFGGESINNLIYEYDPLLNLWIAKFAYPGKKCNSVINFVIEDKVYIGYGNCDFWQFNDTANSWKRLINSPYYGITNSFSIYNKGYVFESSYDQSSESFVSRFLEFDPEKN